jgi:hypothetical protein
LKQHQREQAHELGLDSPFTESKEVIGGWAMLKADSKADAIRIATEFLDLHRKHWPGFEAECEVRPVMEMGDPAQCR